MRNWSTCAGPRLTTLCYTRQYSAVSRRDSFISVGATPSGSSIIYRFKTTKWLVCLSTDDSRFGLSMSKDIFTTNKVNKVRNLGVMGLEYARIHKTSRPIVLPL